MLGHLDDWFYRGIVGIWIDYSLPAGQQVTVWPQIVGDLTSASGACHSSWGPISSAWSRQGTTLTLNVTIPTNATSIVYVPTSSPNTVQESGKLVAQASGVKFLRSAAGAQCLSSPIGFLCFNRPLITISAFQTERNHIAMNPLRISRRELLILAGIVGVSPALAETWSGRSRAAVMPNLMKKEVGPLLQKAMIWTSAPVPGNTHFVAFRKQFTLPDQPRQAMLHLFADVRYLLWINGPVCHTRASTISPQRPGI